MGKLKHRHSSSREIMQLAREGAGLEPNGASVTAFGTTAPLPPGCVPLQPHTPSSTFSQACCEDMRPSPSCPHFGGGQVLSQPDKTYRLSAQKCLPNVARGLVGSQILALVRMEGSRSQDTQDQEIGGGRGKGLPKACCPLISVNLEPKHTAA